MKDKMIAASVTFDSRSLEYTHKSLSGALVLFISLITTSLTATEVQGPLATIIEENCLGCHDSSSAEGGLDLTALTLDLDDLALRNRWIQIHDRVQSNEMPPDVDTMKVADRQRLVLSLSEAIELADSADVLAHGRGPLRRLNREEYEQNLREVLKLPFLDIKDMLPEDREEHLFNKSAMSLDMSRVQLAAYLEAAGSALNQAMASGLEPPPISKYRAVGTELFPATNTFGEREAMFFAKGNQAIATQELVSLKDDPDLELALFRSAHWPYYGYPRGFVAKLPGQYRVRFSARAVLQTEGYRLNTATESVPMTFRARKPSGPDVSGDVRATGGIIDVHPELQIHETIIRLFPTETFEYSLLGLPVPLARNVNGGPPTYRFPPFPEGGQPGVAFQWLEVEGPLPQKLWPPPSHEVLFDDLGVEVVTKNPVADARRLLRRFIQLASREPVPDAAIVKFEQLVLKQLEEARPFPEAMLAGYKAFLASSYFLYLREPSDPATGEFDHYAIASRLSHFLTNTRPDASLLQLAANRKLRDIKILRNETDRMISGNGFDRFVLNFTNYWLNLRHIRRDEPDIRLYPEYRFDDYLIESMERETRRFFTAMIRDNLPSSVLVDGSFAYVNDRLSRHYGLKPVSGSKLTRVVLPDGSPYGGLLTQGAILKVTANGSSTSPVIRGAWIMERLMGQPPPPPPPSVPAVEPDIRGANTIRELLALHTKSKSCAGCHARFDPVGLALENFDIVGGWRTRYRGIEKGEPITGIDRAGHDFAYTLSESVDASGQLLDGRRFQDIHVLKSILADEPRQLARNLLQQLTLYSTGTPVRFSDRKEIETILDSCEENDYRIRDLLHALVQSKIFLGKEGCK